MRIPKLNEEVFRPKEDVRRLSDFEDEPQIPTEKNRAYYKNLTLNLISIAYIGIGSCFLANEYHKIIGHIEDMKYDFERIEKIKDSTIQYGPSWQIGFEGPDQIPVYRIENIDSKVE